MSCLRFRALFFLLTLLFVSTTVFSFSPDRVSDHPDILRERTVSGVIDEEVSVGLIPLGTRRSLIQGNGTTNSSVLILAAQRTYRRDPLSGYKRYTGGWNISNTHYWASVGFTAAPLFLIGVIWFVAFGLCLSCICLYYFCCQRPRYGYSRTAYALSLIFLVLFTIAAIIGSVVLYTGQGKFHASTTDTLDYVVMQANMTVNKLRNVSDYLSSAKQIGVDNVFLPSSLQTKIDQVDAMINSSANTLSQRTSQNADKIQQVVDDVRLILIVIAAVMMVVAFLGFLFSVLGMQFLVYILVIIGWILVAGTFILCGVFLLLHNVVGDSCVAMNEWVQNPTAHTALDDILPCVDNATANATLTQTKQVTFQLVNLVDQVIANVSNRNFPPNFTPLYYNQSGPLMPLLCNPFFPNLMDRQCVAGEVEFNNATQVWRNYVCEVSANGTCTTVGRMTPSMYNQMAAAVNVSYGLYRYAPFLVQLEDCTFVRDTFTEINMDYCPGLRRYSKWVYVGLVMVSAAVMLSLIFWVLYARERRHRVYTKQYDAAYGAEPKAHDRKF
ncbi:uncharacterized protein LOC122064724 [Macadamia integrifolia]|uniref:uncharacterized protein LOC122064724 n=1 Tax=Macadamia integrifolia TaxID=60698 RepID=UPI001C4EF46A|nr:uncharacterized protein LOC122064724 [Macadamia integrifolia]